MPAEARKAMIGRLDVIAANPFAHHANVKPMTGRKGAYRLRQGPWRAVYDLDREKQIMYVLDVDTRGSIYR
jgi:mRNA-degrading endonuclease RelE of RelBE toxin-antitoxin system